MTKVVIIGAGPMGLYLALKLRKAGVLNILIYDPRAGVYTRPGHINTEIFNTLEDKIGEKFWSGQTGHIKDFERILFARVSKLNIPIEKKIFVRFNNDPNHKGVILVNENSTEELVECDYAFDCTGSKRGLIHEVNAVSERKVFTLNQISPQIKVKNHFLAYVKMSREDLKEINLQDQYNTATRFSSLELAQSIERLRQFGWREFGFPKCYGINFTKGKVCLYLECPDDLPPQSYEPWVHAVIDAVTNSTNIAFQQLPPSKKGLKKPRFNSFEVVPMELNQVAYQGPGLPMVVAIGDAQIDPNYYLAHGILDGLDRVDKMIKKMVIINGGIAYFDADEYLHSIKEMLAAHKGSLITHYQERATYFDLWLNKAELFYESAISMTTSHGEKDQFQTTLKEIKARISYRNALTKFKTCHDASGKIPFNKNNLDELNNVFTELNDLLIQTLTDLPPSFNVQRMDAVEKLTTVATMWKDLGNQYFKTAQFNQAIECYKKALTVYQNSIFINQWELEILSVFSNVIIGYRKCNQNLRAIKEAPDILALYPDLPKLQSIKKKILFNLIKAYSSIISEHTDVGGEQINYAEALTEQITSLCLTYRNLMDDELNQALNGIKTLKTIPSIGPSFFSTSVVSLEKPKINIDSVQEGNTI